MSTPNPLMPQGALPEGKSKSNIRLVFIGVFAVHAVFIVGLLIQGCKPESKPKQDISPIGQLPPDTNYLTTPSTNPPDLVGSTNPAIPGVTPGVGAPTPGPVTPGPATPGPVGISPVPPTPAPMPAPVAPEPVAPTGATKEYVVQKGDTFYVIAKSHGLKVADITKANPGVESSKLKIGQKLNLPEGSSAPASAKPAVAGSAVAPAADVAEPATGGTSYTVKTGDTLTKIARNHKVTVAAIRSANSLKTDKIHVGQKLKLPASKMASAAPAAPAVAPEPAPAPIPAPAPATPAPVSGKKI